MEPSCPVHKLVADVALLAPGSALLVRYRDVSGYDGQRGWFLPDDFLEHLEHPDDAAHRIVRDQTGLGVPELTLSHVESFGNGAWHLIFHYVGRVTEPAPVRPGSNVFAAQWFPLDALPDPAEVGHEGWALQTLGRVTSPETPA
jgi:ADP-ribose pyrophosphatase YjhB (NUDIX family)